MKKLYNERPRFFIVATCLFALALCSAVFAANYAGPQLTVGDGPTGMDSTRVTREGAQVVTQLHGAYTEQGMRQRVYTGSSASTGIALIVPATTGGHPTLWNPSDSGRNLSILKLELGYVSGNNAPTTIEWAQTNTTGAAIATAAPIATGTRVNPVSGLLGAPLDNKGVWIPTTNTFTAAPAFFRSSGLSLFTGVAATAVAPFSLVREYHGDFMVAPGNAISLCTQAATTTAVFQVSVTWEEIPVNQ